MGITGKDTVDRGELYPGVDNVLQGGGTCSAAFCLGVVFNIGRYGEDSEGYTHRVSMTYHREAGATKPRQDVGGTCGR